MKFVRLFLTIAVFCAVARAGAPMEPIQKTLIILEHGINPRTGDLYRSTKASRDVHPDDFACNDQGGAAHIWKTHGMTDSLQSQVTGTFNLTYAQAFSDASEAPNLEVGNLADRNYAIARECDGQRLVYSLKGGKIVKDTVQVSGVQTLHSFFEQAVIRWFEGESLKEAANDPTADRDVKLWIKHFRDSAGKAPTLVDLRLQRKDFVPSRFIIIAHSMGGLTTREYVQSSQYAGDVDKVITLDTPHEGSWAVDLNRELLANHGGDFLIKDAIQISGQLALGSTILAFSNNKASDFVADALVWPSFLFGSTEILAKSAGVMTLAMGYGFSDGGNIYLSPQSDPLRRINNLREIGNGYPSPAFRLFHNEGMISPANPKAFVGSSTFAGAIIPKSYQSAIVAAFGSAQQDYVSTPSEQIFENVFLSTALGVLAQMNFSNQGTIVVPAFSSKGENVALFSEPKVDIRRHLFSIPANGAQALGLEGILLNSALKMVRDGYLRQAIYVGLNKSATFPATAWTRFLKPAIAFGLITAMDYEMQQQQKLQPSYPNVPAANTWTDVLKTDLPVLATSHDYATIQSTIERIPTITIKNPAGQDLSAQPTLMEDFLYETPYASILSVDSINHWDIGLMNSKGKSLCQVVKPQPEIDYSRTDWQSQMAIKQDEWTFAPGSTVPIRHPKRYLVPDGLLVTSFPEELRFTVDDLRPDLMKQFGIVFNYNRFSLTWSRRADGKYDVFKNLDTKPFLTAVENPIDPKGNWVIRPKDYLDTTKVNLSSVYMDGQNAVALHFFNNAGRIGNQRFFFTFQATPPLITMNWPLPYSVISNQKPLIDAEINNQAYANILGDPDSTYFKILPRTPTGDDSSNTSRIHFDGTPNTDYNLKAFHLRHNWASGSLSKKGNLWLEITATTRRLDSLGRVTQGAHEIRRIPFTLDTALPILALGAPTIPVNPDNSPLFLRYTFDDAPVQELQNLRAQVRDKTGLVQYEFKPMAHVGGQSSAFAFQGVDADGNALPDGEYRFHLSARDAAVPDSAGLHTVQALLNLYPSLPAKEGKVTSEFDSVWNSLQSQPGFHFAEADSAFYLDRHKPEFQLTAHAALIKSGDYQAFRFHLSDLAPRDSATVRWQLTRKGFGTPEVLQTFETRHSLQSETLSSAPLLTVDEPPMSLFADGVYTFAVQVTDAAKNAQSFSDSTYNFRIDRAAPRVLNLVSSPQTFDSQHPASAAAITWQVDEAFDAPENRETDTGKFVARTQLKVKSPAGEYVLTPTWVPITGERNRFRAALPTTIPWASYKGRWAVELTVSDAVGNTTHATGDIWLDVRPPKITSPVADVPVFGHVGIMGLAENPSLTGSFSYYELAYRKLGDSTWRNSGISVPETRRGPGGQANRSLIAQSFIGSLATWDVTGLVKGESYQLVLRTAASTDSMQADTVEVQITTPESSFVDFKATLGNVPVVYAPRSGPVSFGVTLQQGPIGSTPKPEQIYAANLTLTDAAGNILLDQPKEAVKVSPFAGEPNNKDIAGVYLWNGVDLKWTLQVSKAPDSLKFLLQYFGVAAMPLQCSGGLQCQDLSVNKGSVDFPDEPALAYNRILQVTIAKGASGAAIFTLPTRAGLIILKARTPISAADTASPLLEATSFFAGQSRTLIFNHPEPGAPASIVPSFVINPAPYAFTTIWDGLRQNGMYPASGIAQLKATIRDAQSGQVREAESTFVIGKVPDSLSVSTDPSVFLWQPGSDLSRITLLYKLFGNPAYLTAGVRKQNGDTLITFFSDSLHQPRPSEYSLNWNGLLRDQSGAQLISAGQTLQFFVSARPTPGKSTPLSARDSMSFSVQSAHWREDTSLVLRVPEDEGHTFGSQTYVKALPKFTLAAEPMGQIADATQINYQVQYQGKQKALAYDAQRFNVWMQRTRDEFNVILVGKFQSRLKNYWNSFWHPTCQSASVYMERFFVIPLTFKKGQPITLPDFIYSPESESYVFRCREASCAPDLERTVSFYLLPGSQGLPPITTPQQYVDKKLGALYVAYDIQLFDSQIIQFGPVYSNGSWTSNPNGSAASYPAVGSWFRKTQLVPSTPLPGPDANCGFITDPTKGDHPGLDSNGNQIFDKGDRCADGINAYDPHDNLVEYNIEPSTPGGFPYNNEDPTLCTPDHNHTRLGFRLKLRVPDVYWNPPFGYNNLASRSMRWDPANAFLYDASNGYFMKDGKDNHSGARQDGALDYNGYITPFEKQIFSWLPFSQAAFVNTPGSGNQYAQYGPLSFGPDDHQDMGTRLKFGFNNNPEMGGSSKFVLRLTKSTCLNTFNLFNATQAVCSQSASDSLLGEWNSRDHAWTGHSQQISSLLFVDVPGLVRFRNYHFELALKAKPEEYSTLSGRSDSLPWPLSQPLDRPSQAGSEIKYRREYYPATSNLRFGIGDNLAEVNGLTPFLQPGSAYVDAAGCYRTPLDPAFVSPKSLPPSVVTGQNILTPLTRTLVSGLGSEFFYDDIEYFRKTGGAYSNQQGSEKFGQNVNITSAVPIQLLPTGLPYTEISVAGQNAMHFTGGSSRAWSGVEDPGLRGRDLDQDGIVDEDGLNANDADGDHLIAEDPRGAMVAKQIFPPQALSSTYELFRDLYRPSMAQLSHDTAALFQERPDNSVVYNSKISNLNFNPQLFYPDGSSHDEGFTATVGTSFGNPAATPVVVTRTSPLKKSKELITLLTNAKGSFDVSYLDVQGNLRNAFSGNGAGILSPRAFFDIKTLQGKTSLFLTQRQGGDSITYRKLDLQIGEPVNAGRDITSLYGDASVHFEPGVVPDSLFFTVRLSNLTETGLAQTNQLSVIGPVIEVKPSLVFDPSKPLPQVHIRLTRAQVGSLNLASLKIYKPDGENLVPLEQTRFAFYNDNVRICAETPDAVCTSNLWNIVDISGTATSFSHFLVLDASHAQAVNFTLTALPQISSDSLRNIRVTGLPMGAVRLYLDDDSIFADAEDATPPQALETSGFVTDSAGLTGQIQLPGKTGVYHVFAFAFGDSKIRQQTLELVQPMSFSYLGASIIPLGSESQNRPFITYAAGQAMHMTVRFYRFGLNIGSLDFPGTLPASQMGYANIPSEWGALLEEGHYQSILEARDLSGEFASVAGPDFWVDHTPPLVDLQVAFHTIGTGGTLTANVAMNDLQGDPFGVLSTYLGNEKISHEYFTSPNETINIFVTGAQFSAHLGDSLRLVLEVRDEVGNTTILTWSQPPLFLRRFQNFKLDGSFIDGTLTGFPVPLKLKNDSLGGFNFFGTQEDGSDLYVTLPDGKVLPQHVEYYRPNENEATLWIGFPSLKAGQDMYFTLHWGNKPEADYARNYAEYAPNGLNGWWHFNRELSAHDVSGYGNDGAVFGAAGFKGVTGEGFLSSSPGVGMRVPFNPSLAIDNAFTLSAWVYTDSLHRAKGEWFHRETKAENGIWSASLDSTRISMQIENQKTTVPAKLAWGWNHLAYVFDRNQYPDGRIYVNGRSFGTGVFSPGFEFGADTSSFFFGSTPDSTGFVGGIDEARISLLPRTSAWIRLEYELLKTGSQGVKPFGDTLPKPDEQIVDSLLSFENVKLWSFNFTPPRLDSNRTNGLWSLPISNRCDEVRLVSSPLAARPLGPKMQIDVNIPFGPRSSKNRGELEVDLNVPSLRMREVHLGEVQFRDLPQGSFQTLHWNIPCDVWNKLKSKPHADARLTLNVLVPEAKAVYLLDNIHFLPEGKEFTNRLSAYDVLNFESEGGWTSHSDSISLFPQPAEGVYALAVQLYASGNCKRHPHHHHTHDLNSAMMNYSGVDSVGEISVQLPSGLSSKPWKGEMRVYLDARSIGVCRSLAARLSFAGASENGYQIFRYTVPKSLLAKFKGKALSDFRIYLEVDLPEIEGQIQFDQIRFTGK